MKVGKAHINHAVEQIVRLCAIPLHGLVGPGVYASHGYERTHREGVENTLKLLAAYIQEPMPESGWEDGHDGET